MPCLNVQFDAPQPSQYQSTRHINELQLSIRL